MRLRTAQGKLKVEHSIVDGIRPVLERLLGKNPDIRSVIPGVIRPVRDARGEPVIRVTVPTANGWEGDCAECRCAPGTVYQYGLIEASAGEGDRRRFGDLAFVDR
jgi:hypothetical protein